MDNKAEQIREYIDANPMGVLRPLEYINKIAEDVGVTFFYARKIYYETVNKNEVRKDVGTDLIERRYKGLLSDQKKKYNHLLEEYEDLQSRFQDLLIVSEDRDIDPIPVAKDQSTHEATAIIQASDWHIDEVVTENQTNGLNKYNPEIAKTRSQNFANNCIKLLRKERRDVQIDNMIIHLGGDFIGGWIHDELQQTNSMSPIEATMFAQELLSAVLEFILNHGDLNRIICLCNRGNHGRTTRRMQYANEPDTNYETFIYSYLQKKFPEIDFQVPDSDIGHFEVYGHNIRYYHGHQVRYMGGVGGISISLNKKQAAWDETRKAIYNLMGHYHNLSHPNTKTTLNGSLIGYNAFAQSGGFKYEPPLQSFQLFDAKRKRITIRAAIDC